VCLLCKRIGCEAGVLLQDAARADGAPPEPLWTTHDVTSTSFKRVVIP
jgi:hypothetical protein